MTDTKDVDIPNETFFANALFFDLEGPDVIIDFVRKASRYDAVPPHARYTVTEHATVVLHASLFKDLVVRAARIVVELEKRYGELGTPEFFRNFEAAQQKTLKATEHPKASEKPSYYG